MAQQIVVTKKSNENSMGVLRRFRKKARTSGIAKHLRGIRFAERPKSDFQQKKSKIKSLRKKAENERLYKLGKIESK
jgi:ribosomal protein S21